MIVLDQQIEATAQNAVIQEGRNNNPSNDKRRHFRSAYGKLKQFLIFILD